MKVEPGAPAADTERSRSGHSRSSIGGSGASDAVSGVPRFGPFTARGWAVLAVGVSVVLAVAFRLYSRSDLWLDESLTVNISRRSPSELLHLLRHDGAPPLYYLVLHYWMKVFGTSNVAVRLLSGVIGLVSLPLAYVAGRRLAGSDPERRRWIAWGSMLVVGSSPYAIRYSTEVRMYMLEAVFVLAGYLLVRELVDRAGDGRPVGGALVGVTVTTALLLYTQYWALYLLPVVGATFLWRAVRAPEAERRAPRLLVGALVAGGVLWLPWVPTFLYQAVHTGTPWATPTSPSTAVAFTITDFAGSSKAEGWALLLPLTLLGLLALFGQADGRYRIALDVRTVPGVRWEWWIGAATLLVAVTLAYAQHGAFVSRYASVMFPFFALCVAAGLMVFGDVRLRAATLAVVVVLGFVGGVRNVREQRTQAGQVAAAIASGAKPGDYVIYCPDQVGPDVNRALTLDDGRLSAQLVQKTFPTLAGPEIVDWVDYARRNDRADPTAIGKKVLAQAVGHTIWYVWSGGYRTYGFKCEALSNVISGQRPDRADPIGPDQLLFEHMGLTRFGP